MTWATPAVAGLVAACLVPPLILLYFLKLRRREQVIPSTLLWKQSVQDLQANALFQRLRPNWLLFLQLMAMICLFIAIAQPEHLGSLSRGSRTVLLIDRSASMAATDAEEGEDRTRLDEAKRQALEYIEGIDTGGLLGQTGESEQVMVIGFADEAQVYSPFTSSKAQLRQAVEAVTPTHGGSSLKQAVELARAYTTNTDMEMAGRDVAPPATLIVFSDGRIRDLPELVAKRNEPVVYRPTGAAPGGEEPARNLGIAALGARRSLTEPDALEIYVRVANYTDAPATVDVELSVGAQLLHTRTITVAPTGLADPRAETGSEAPPPSGEDAADAALAGAASAPRRRPGSNSVTFALNDPRGLTIGVRLDAEDDFAPDNAAFAVIPPAKQLVVGLVAPDDGWVVESAMAGVPFLERIDRLSPERFAALAQSGETDKYDAIVIDGVSVAALGPGRYLTLGIAPPLEGFAADGEARPNEPVTWDEEHPINDSVTYFTLQVAPTPPLAIPAEAKVLVEGNAGPLLVETSRRDVAAVSMAFRPVASNWPFDVNLVKFMQNALDYLGHYGEALTQEDRKPGQAIDARLPRDATDIRITLPDGRTNSLAPTDPTRTSYPADLAGLYTIQHRAPGVEAEQSQQVAVNLFDEFECDIRPAESITFGRDDTFEGVDSEESVRKRVLWPYALLAALAFMLLEWWVYNRRAYV